MRIRAILNPRAGLAAQRALAPVERGRPSWRSIEVQVTRGPGHARDLARESAERGDDLVLVVGGDGTANEAAWGLLGSSTALGLVPVGSGNGLARTLGVSLVAERALAQLEEGARRRMDVGWINGRPFLNVAGAGFDAEVGATFHDRARNGGRRGILPLVWIAMGKAMRYRAETWTVEFDDEKLEASALIVAFLNGRQWGAGAVIAPRARLDDGRLDLVVIRDAPRAQLFLNAPRLFFGSIERFRGYSHAQITQARLTPLASAVHHRDGEPEPGCDRLEVHIEPRALEVLVPRPTAEDPDGPFSPS